MSYFIFSDMNSGGYSKINYSKVIVEAYSYDEAVTKFERYFDVDPYAVSCECCGQDFIIYDIDEEDLEDYREDIENPYSDIFYLK